MKKYKPKSKYFKKSEIFKEENSSSEPSLEYISFESETVQQQQLEPDSISESNKISSNEYKIDSETSFNSDDDTNLPNPSEDIELDKIFGINQPTFDASFVPLMFYVKYKNKSDRSCEWIDEEKLTRIKKGKIIYSIFQRNQTPFRPVHFFNQTDSSSTEDDEFKLFKPAKVEFDEGFLIQEKVISIETQKSGKTKYLVKWLSLDITESTWETDVSEDLITKYKENNSFTHMPCYDHSENQNLIEFDEIKESPIFKNENVLTDYQVDGLNWLQYCWFNNVNSILADEMGLGKTIESISIIECLSKWYPNWGPFFNRLSTFNKFFIKSDEEDNWWFRSNSWCDWIV